MINCVLRNHNFVNEVQVITQVFFPWEKFAFTEAVANAGYTVESLWEADTARAVVYKDGEELSRYVWCGGMGKREFNPRRVVMLALYRALREAIGTYTPWGALTGIRPSKLVREWMDYGRYDDEIIATLMNPFCCNEEKARLALNVAHAEKRVERRIRDTIGVYISVPFCPSRCSYCSFNTSHKPASENTLHRYINALIDEIREKFSCDIGTVSSIYIGGGTPTFLPENLLERLLDEVCSAFCSNGVEFTVEAGRPDTLTAEKLKILHKYGVNRIAVNPQTFNDSTLKSIGRNHTAADFLSAFNQARDIGFNCINVDLIAGLPDETPDDMCRNMEALAELSPENITIHTLAVKRASRMNEKRSEAVNREKYGSVGVAEEAKRGLIPIVAAGIGIEPHLYETMLSIAAKSCAEMKLSPYYLYRQKNMVGLFENIGYSLPNRECLYNVGMMAEVQTILGIGAGAVSKFIIPSSENFTQINSNFSLVGQPPTGAKDELLFAPCNNGSKIIRKYNVKNSEIYLERRGF